MAKFNKWHDLICCYDDSVGKPFSGTNLYNFCGSNPVNFIDPFGLYYNLSFNFGYLGGITGGIMFGYDGGIYPYLGYGAMSSSGISLTWNDSDHPTPGWNSAFAGGCGIVSQYGYSQADDVWGPPEWGIGTKGVAYTPSYVFGPFYWR